MSIYNNVTLKNIFIKKQVLKAFAEGYINKEIFNSIIAAYPSDIYSPDFFVSIGLGLLTLLIILASAGMSALLSGFSGSTISFVLAIVCYLFLEIMCGKKRHKDSGVDIVLIAATASFIAIGFSVLLTDRQEDIWLPFILLIILAWFTYRFVNMPAGAATAVCLLFLIFNIYSSLGQFTVFSFPYALIVVSAAIYFIAKKQTKRNAYYVYYTVFQAIKIISLFAFYLSGNYYVVDKIIQQNYLLNAQSALSAEWIFWCWTFAVPIVYLTKGIKNKNLLLVRAGMLMIIASILTFRYYYTVISAETAMISGGVIMIIISYLFMNFLRRPKHGFIYIEEQLSGSGYQDAEAFALSQFLSPQHVPDTETKFGDGNFGGAGSGSGY